MVVFEQIQGLVRNIASDEERFAQFIRLRARSDEELDYTQLLTVFDQWDGVAEIHTYDGWKKRKRFVRRGEHGIPYADENSPFRSKVSYAFDISQTDGVPLPKRIITQEQVSEIYDDLCDICEAYTGEQITFSKEDIADKLGVTKKIEKEKGNERTVAVHESDVTRKRDTEIEHIQPDGRADRGNVRSTRARGDQRDRTQLTFFDGFMQEGGMVREDGVRAHEGNEFSEVYADVLGLYAVGGAGAAAGEDRGVQGRDVGGVRAPADERPDRADQPPSDVREHDRGEDLRRDHQTVLRGRVTPYYAAYVAAQEENPDAVCAVRVGDFYEVFGDGAVTAAEEAGLTLTSRDVGLEERVPMCGFPFFSAQAYFEKILAKHDVLVLDEGQEPRLIKAHAPEVVQTTQQKGIKERAKKVATLFDIAAPAEKSGKDQLIERVLKRGSGFEDGRIRIYEKYQKNPTTEEFARFLKDEYGVGGFGRYGGDNSDHDAKGIRMSYLGEHGEKIVEAFLKWNEVAVRIADLIDANDYLSDEDKAKIAKIESIVSGMVESGTQNTNDSSWVIYFDEFGKDEEFVRKNERMILSRLSEREEVAEIERLENGVDLTFYLKYCPNYEDIWDELAQNTPAAEPQESAQEKGEIAPQHNYRMTDADFEVRPPKVRVRDNIAAIRTVQKIVSEKRPATSDEQEILAKYVGWGGLAEVFDEGKAGWAQERGELKDLLPKHEYQGAKESTLNAHFTPKAVIDGIYAGLERLGVRDAQVLEPSCGTGNFIGCAPEEMKLRFDGVELDGLTAQIGKVLYPESKIKNSGFEDVAVKKDGYDVVVGNVPFGNYKLYDSAYARENFLIHDYFIAKGLDELRAGGVMAVVTSSGTMDKADDRARKYFAQRAELLGAYRLPDNTFGGNAGTETVTDILFFRKREEELSAEEAEKEPWVRAVPQADGLGTLNAHFDEYPEHVLGTFTRVSGRFGDERTVKANAEDLREQLKSAVSDLPQGIYRAADSVSAEYRDETELAGKDYNYVLDGSRVYIKAGAERWEPQSKQLQGELTQSMFKRVQAYITLRNTVNGLIQIQVDGCSDEALAEKQAQLNAQYDAFVKNYGYLTAPQNEVLFRGDNDYSLVSTLENYDKETKTAEKTEIFTQRTIRRAEKKTHTDDVFEAVDLSRNHLGGVDIRYIERLTGLGYEDVVSQLKEHIFQEITPADIYAGRADRYTGWRTRDEYLSGNVVEKLKTCRAALAALNASETEEKETLRARLTHNEEALAGIQPKPLTSNEIRARMGATWVEADDYWNFLEHLVANDGYIRKYSSDGIEYSSYNGQWYVHAQSGYRHRVEARSVWGTERMNALDIFDCALNSRTPTVYDKVRDADGRERQVTNQAETAMAREKLRAMQEEFGKWLWENPRRKEKYERIYNERFNNTVLPEYHGGYLTFNGMNATMRLREHQKDAVARIAAGGNVLLHHSVGAGKTYEMIAGAMKLKEYGVAAKPMFVVPNAIIGQWAKEIKTLYPQAKVLVTTKDEFEKKNRGRFISKIAAGNWDMVVISESQFSKIPVSPERQLQKLEAEKEYIERALSEVKERGYYREGGRLTVKALAEAKKRCEAKVKSVMDKIEKRQDNLLTFEQLGVDYLFVDEAHAYKNKELVTQMRNVAGLSTSGSERAFDMEMKIEYLSELHDGMDKGIVFATGTPISNSMAEMYTMQSYLGRNDLQRAGVQFFDAWANTFGETVTSLELKPSGDGVRPRTRFSRFVNLPELQLMYRKFADVKTAEMLNLPVPEAERITHTLPATEQILEYNDEIIARGAAIERGGVDPSRDNMLKLTSDGKKLALDPRCYDPSAKDEPQTKVNECVRIAHDIYQQTAQEKGTQVIFCDQSTPKGNEWSVYRDIREKLIAAGVNAEEIAFIHDADTDAKREKLFEAMNEGKIRILLGSTQKCGVGANFQKRLKALHHLDVPYRPADMEQREGRIIRQGNMNERVEIHTYVTERTFDSYSYQILENKQRFISQINKGDMSVREASDIDDTTMSYAQIKAIATANPDFLRQMQVISDIKNLQMLKQKHAETQSALRRRVSIELPQELAAAENRLAQLKADMEGYTETPVLELDGKIYDTMTDEAAEHFREVCEKTPNGQTIGMYGGMKIAMRTAQSFTGAAVGQELMLTGEGCYRTDAGLSARGNLTRIGNLYKGLPDVEKNTQDRIVFLISQLAESTKQADKPFEREEELSALQRELEEINARLQVDKDEVAIETQETESDHDKEISGREKVYEEKNVCTGQNTRS